MKLRLKNFLSYDKLELEIEQNYIVVGHNGAGKSAILDAIIYGLYGKYRRGNLVQAIQKGQNYLEIELEFKSFKIIRKYYSSGKSDVVLLLKNGERIIGQKNVYEFIEDKLVNYDLFELLYCFKKRFSELGDFDRKKLFEMFVDLSMVDKLLEKLKNMSILLSKDYSAKESLFQYINVEIKSIEEKINNYKEIDISKKDEFENILKLYDEYMGCVQRQKVLYNDIQKIENNLKSLYVGKCPYCGFVIKKESFIEKENKMKMEKMQEVEKINQKIKEILNKEKDIDKINIQELQIRLQKMKSVVKVEDLKESVKKKREELEKIEVKLKELSEVLEKVKYWIKMLDLKHIKFDLMNNFVSYFIEQLNNLLEVSEFDLRLDYELSDVLQLFIIDKMGIKRELENASLGERRIIDIFILLTLRILFEQSKNKRFPYLFCDEIEGIDNDNMNKLINVLSYILKNDNFVMITHQSIYDNKSVGYIYVEKEKNISRVRIK